MFVFNVPCLAIAIVTAQECFATKLLLDALSPWQMCPRNIWRMLNLGISGVHRGRCWSPVFFFGFGEPNFGMKHDGLGPSLSKPDLQLLVRQGYIQMNSMFPPLCYTVISLLTQIAQHIIGLMDKHLKPVHTINIRLCKLLGVLKSVIPKLLYNRILFAKQNHELDSWRRVEKSVKKKRSQRPQWIRSTGNFGWRET